MSLVNRLKLFHLLYFSQPAADRVVYRIACRASCRKIIELGIGKAERAKRLLWALAHDRGNGTCAESMPIEYIGFDMFEGGDGPSLKDVFRTLRSQGVRVRLIPGEPHCSLARWANEVGAADLVLVSAASHWSEHPRLWRFVPRLLRPQGILMIEQQGGNGRQSWEQWDASQIEAMKRSAESRRAA